MTIWKGSTLILSLEEWGMRAKPKREFQWAKHRSAMEIADTWLRSGDAMPDKVLRALKSHPDFGPVTGGRPSRR